MKPKPTQEQLQHFIGRGLSQREIAAEIGISQTTIGRYMRKFGLQTTRRRGPRRGAKPFHCTRCGENDPEKFARHWYCIKYSKCIKCHAQEQSQRYTKYRLQSIKRMGGKCCLCGYDKYHGSLHFHHLDPSQKDPQWKLLKARPVKQIRAELSKCILVCANCHGEIHAGLVDTKLLQPGAASRCRSRRRCDRPSTPAATGSASTHVDDHDAAASPRCPPQTGCASLPR